MESSPEKRSALSVPALDPQIIEALRRLEESGAPDVETVPIAEARANFAELCKREFGPVEEMHSVEDGEADGVPIRIYRPVETSEPSMGLIYFHGGGWVLGSIDTHDGITRAFAKAIGCIVVSVDYRLAPEHRYPAALDDAWAATRHILKHPGDYGIDADHVGVAGDSVGGTLAAIVARKSTATDTPLSAQVLLYPATSSRGDTESYSLFSSGYGLTRANMNWYWKQYLGDVEGKANADISPGAARELRRLPRAVVVTAEADILRDEAEGYAQRLNFSGVNTEGWQYEGMIHGFLRFAGTVDRAKAAFEEIAESVRPALESGWRENLAATHYMDES